MAISSTYETLFGCFGRLAESRNGIWYGGRSILVFVGALVSSVPVLAKTGSPQFEFVPASTNLCSESRGIEKTTERLLPWRGSVQVLHIAASATEVECAQKIKDAFKKAGLNAVVDLTNGPAGIRIHGQLRGSGKPTQLSSATPDSTAAAAAAEGARGDNENPVGESGEPETDGLPAQAGTVEVSDQLVAAREKLKELQKNTPAPAKDEAPREKRWLGKASPSFLQAEGSGLPASATGIFPSRFTLASKPSSGRSYRLMADFPILAAKNLPKLQRFEFGVRQALGGEDGWGEWTPPSRTALYLNAAAFQMTQDAQAQSRSRGNVLLGEVTTILAGIDAEVQATETWRLQGAFHLVPVFPLSGNTMTMTANFHAGAQRAWGNWEAGILIENYNYKVNYEAKSLGELYASHLFFGITLATEF